MKKLYNVFFVQKFFFNFKKITTRTKKKLIKRKFGGSDFHYINITFVKKSLKKSILQIKNKFQREIL